METASGIYTSVVVCKNELIEEKIGVLADIIFNLRMIFYMHYDSKYIKDAIMYIYAYSMQFMAELNREHTIYDNIIEYLESFEYITDLEDKEILSNLSNILDKLEVAMEQRIIYYAAFLDKIDSIISSPILTNTSYLYPNYISTLSEEDAYEMINSISYQRKK